MNTNKLLCYLAVKYNGEWQKIYDAIKTKEPVNNEILDRGLKDFNNQYITLLDEIYPERYKSSFQDPPIVLFYKGDISLLKNPKLKYLSVVGSRDASEYGKSVVASIVYNLSDDFCIVSGLAKGIDSVAHQAALDSNKKTIAFLGSGIDYVYPEENKELYQRIIDNGGLIMSEYPGFAQPKKENFTFRNRLVAGLSDVLLVGEAYSRSGTSVTVNYALQGNCQICCVPYEAGVNSICNSLIKEGAALVENSQDVAQLYQ